MIKIILCEGETDQILIGYYLETVCDWKYKSGNLAFRGEPISWFEREGEELGIWACHGHDFSRQLSAIGIYISNSIPNIDKVLVISDNDDDSSEHILKNYIIEFINMLTDESVSIKQGRWTEVVARVDLGENRIKASYLLLPSDENGALETFMLNALAESDTDMQSVIAQVKDFISDVKSNKFLKKRREKTKAELGTSIAIFNPDKVFDTMKEFIKSVNWEKYSEINRTFEILKEM